MKEKNYIRKQYVKDADRQKLLTLALDKLKDFDYNNISLSKYGDMTITGIDAKIAKEIVPVFMEKFEFKNMQITGNCLTVEQIKVKID